MPANGSSKSGPAAKTPGTGSFMNDYLADWDDENPFRSPSPEPAKNDKKDVLGIEKELDLKKKPRAPRVKLDDTRLLSEKGIPKLRKMAPKLKLKGKGHEFSDAARLLTFYQEWLDDLFPKATFLDALTMVEKAGHKTALRNARMKWIDEGRPKGASVVEDGGDPFGEDNRIYQTERRKGDEGLAEVFEKAAAAAAERERAKTPTRDLFGDEDIYDATPRRNVGSGGAPAGQGDDGVPDEDDLDALMAEAGAGPGSTQQKAAEPPVRSIFGNGMSSRVVQPTGEPDEDDLDALMAEAEAEAAQSSSNGPPAKKSIFGDGMGKAQAAQGGFDEDDDLDALMAEAEAEAVAAQAGKYKEAVGSKPQPAGQTGEYGDDDDLDALMAEAEAEASAAAKSSGAGTEGPPKQADKAQGDVSFEAEEEVMAEMEGLW